jgi:hypothetical protein
MGSYSNAAMELAMKVQEVISRAMAKKINWWQAAGIIGISDRQMWRWRERLEEFGYDELFDRRRGQPSPKRFRWPRWSGFWDYAGIAISISTCNISTRSQASSMGFT